MNRSKTIAVQLGYFEGIHTDVIWPLFQRYIQERGYNALFLPGRSLRSPIPLDYQFNRIYNFLHPQCVDGIIFTAGMDHFTNQEEQIQVIKEFGNIPKIAMGAAIPGIPSVSTSNRNGILGAVEHLYDHHKRRHIAFLSGPGESFEAQQRRLGYLDFFKQRGLEVDSNLMVEGLDFTGESGTAGVVELLHGKKCHFDGLVCSNDDQAKSAYDELMKRGYDIPGDISLIGFDDIPTLKTNRIGLSSVHQPLVEMCLKTAESMDKMLQGKEVPMFTELPISLSIRSSCGCYSENLKDLYDVTLPREKSIEASEFPKTRLLKYFPSEEDGMALLMLLQRWMTQLLESRDFPNDSKHILDELNRGLTQGTMSQMGVKNWHHLFNTLIDWIYRYPLNQESFRLFSDFFQKVRILISEKQSVMDNLKMEDSFRHNEVLRILSQRFIFTSDFSQIEYALKESLSGLGIQSLHIMLFEGEMDEERAFYMALPHYSRPVISISPPGEAVSAKRRFPTKKLMSNSMKGNGRFSYIVLPLFQTEEMLGYILIKPGPDSGGFYSNLLYLLSGAMKSVVLYQSQQDYQKKLKKTLKQLEKSNKKLIEQNRVDAVTTLYNRRGFYSRAENNLELISRMHKKALLFYGDLDGLKLINDTLGHQAGDQAIIGAAWALKQTFRSTDIIARFGGDEFVVMTMDVEEDNLKDIFYRLNKNLKLINKEISNFHISLSMGYVYVDPSKGHQTIDDLLHLADNKLYQEKQRKKGKRLSLVGLENSK
ncbi:MAG: GGDEF domain-containing protein [Spirochaetaceae bacterium]|nr:GGDEF domain-containing protein [Spirochaetaceae bacterium]